MYVCVSRERERDAPHRMFEEQSSLFDAKKIEGEQRTRDELPSFILHCSSYKRRESNKPSFLREV